jgi:DNA-binding PadR family transcriptional regulator
MYAEILILAMLRQRPQHGYEIKKSVEQAVAGSISLNNKVLYPTLKHFEEVGAVIRHVEPQVGKPNRHVYELTERGIELLHAYLSDFPPDLAGSDAEFFTRVAFFDYLELPERQAILHTRLAYLQGVLRYLQSLEQLAQAEYPSDYARRVLAFQLQQMRNEYDWVAAWLEEMQANTA